MAETKLTIENLRPPFDGEWVVTKATHTSANGGYTTSVEASTPQPCRWKRWLKLVGR